MISALSVATQGLLNGPLLTAVHGLQPLGIVVVTRPGGGVSSEWVAEFERWLERWERKRRRRARRLTKREQLAAERGQAIVVVTPVRPQIQLHNILSSGVDWDAVFASQTHEEILRVRAPEVHEALLIRRRIAEEDEELLLLLM